MKGTTDTHHLISIIVPVYKCENYLGKCVESIAAQTYRNLEIILVDDGSPDNCGKICDELAKEDERIKVIHKENGGVSSARNAGLDSASGELIMFVDSDDIAHPDICEHLLSLMDEQCDLVVSERYRNTIFELDINKTESVEYKITLHNEVPNAFYEMFDKQILNCPYAKLFRKAIISEQRYDTGITLGEDLLFNLNYLKKVKGSVKISSYCGYMYYIANANSITNNFRESDFITALYLNKQLKEFAYAFKLKEEIYTQIDKILVLDTMVYLQSLYFSNTPRAYKREKALKCLENDELANCCSRKYDFSLTDKPFFYFLKTKNERALSLYFKLKKIVKRFI